MYISKIQSIYKWNKKIQTVCKLTGWNRHFTYCLKFSDNLKIASFDKLALTYIYIYCYGYYQQCTFCILPCWISVWFQNTSTFFRKEIVIKLLLFFWELNTYVGAQLRASVKPHKYHSIMVSIGSRRAINWGPMMPRDASISDGCTPERCSFFSSRDLIKFTSMKYSSLVRCATELLHK